MQSRTSEPDGRPPRRVLRLLEYTFWTLALVCLLPFGATYAAREYVLAQAERQAADRPPITGKADAAGAETPPLPAGGQPAKNRAMHPTAAPRVPLTTESWSVQRRNEYTRLSNALTPEIEAYLRFPRLRSNIPVFAGDTEVNMTLGAGHLSDTSPLDGTGNIAVTAHRDGAFRLLKDVAVGDPIELETPHGTRTFEIRRIDIVEPTRVDLIAPTPQTTLTLITCYPFYFVGKAPRRFVVQAELADTHAEGRTLETTMAPNPAQASPNGQP